MYSGFIMILCMAYAAAINLDKAGIIESPSGKHLIKIGEESFKTSDKNGLDVKKGDATVKIETIEKNPNPTTKIVENIKKCETTGNPTKYEYTISESYTSRTEKIVLTPLIEPMSDSLHYTFTVNRMPIGLIIDDRGVISGYIESDKINQFNLTLKGEKEIEFIKEVNIVDPVCEANDEKGLPQSHLGEQVVTSERSDKIREEKYSCTIDESGHRTTWKLISGGKIRAAGDFLIEYEPYNGIQGLNISIKSKIENPGANPIEFTSNAPNGVTVDRKTGAISGIIPFQQFKLIAITAKGEKTASFSVAVAITANLDINNKKCNGELKYGTLGFKKCGDGQVGLQRNYCNLAGNIETESNCQPNNKDVDVVNINLKFRSNSIIQNHHLSGIAKEFKRRYNLDIYSISKSNDFTVDIGLLINSNEYRRRKEYILEFDYNVEVPNLLLNCYESKLDIDYIDAPKKASSSTGKIIGGSVGGVVGLILIVAVVIACKKK